MCKSCYNSQRKQARKPVDNIARLKQQLYKRLYALDQGVIARSLKRDSIEAILRLHGIEAVDAKRILVPTDTKDFTDLRKYGVVRYIYRD